MYAHIFITQINDSLIGVFNNFILKLISHNTLSVSSCRLSGQNLRNLRILSHLSILTRLNNRLKRISGLFFHLIVYF